MSLALRPSFSVDLPIPSHLAIERLCAQLTAGPQVLRRTRVPGGGAETAKQHREHLVLTVHVSQQRLWSPWLMIDVSPRDAGTHLFARFSPHPSVWTGFAFGYLTVGAVLLFSLIFAGALAMTGGEPWTLKISAAALLVVGVMWWSAHLGQRLARSQMEVLRAELERATEACNVGAREAGGPSTSTA